jgi:ketosteroid isomerase-like protein
MAGEQLDPSEVAALRRLLDERAIVDCVNRYARGVDRADLDMVRSAYHPDAVEDHGAYIGGVDGLVTFLAAAHEPFDGYQRFVTNFSIEVADDGREAHAESYYLCVLRRDQKGELLANGGRYVDRLEKRDGEWRILRRVVVMDWEGTIDGGAPRYDLNVPSRRDRTDVSYERPLEVTREPRSPI